MARATMMVKKAAEAFTPKARKAVPEAASDPSIESVQSGEYRATSHAKR